MIMATLCNLGSDIHLMEVCQFKPLIPHWKISLSLVIDFSLKLLGFKTPLSF